MSWGQLAEACADMQGCYSEIARSSTEASRPLGTYFRLCFFGRRLGPDLDGNEFIYRQPNVTPLAAFSLALQEQYARTYGAVEIIMDSNDVDRSKLDPDAVHIQLAHVVPYFESAPQAYFEEHHGIRAFVLETPYTLGGGARGSADEQCKRKLVMTVEAGLSFPHMKRRLRVVHKREILLQPLDVAVEEAEAWRAEARLYLNSPGAHCTFLTCIFLLLYLCACMLTCHSSKTFLCLRNDPFKIVDDGSNKW